ncbi:hypothetical protein [Rheinheimera sp.]|uniref:hypothetical protein n=1 Tax=Rheinheimera sp. TaxID=1869214 RepID=UPI0027BA350D|nr:hypothetical protein [Rheinheimera sp.]
MAVNRQTLTIAEQSVNGIAELQEVRKHTNDSVNANAVSNNYENTRTEFPKAAGFFRRLSKTCVPKFLNNISEISERRFRNSGQFFRNIFESFLKNFRRKAAPAVESSETEVLLIYVVIVRKSA